MPECVENQVVVNSIQSLAPARLQGFAFRFEGKRCFRGMAYNKRPGMPDEAIVQWMNDCAPLDLSKIYRIGKRIFFEHSSSTGEVWNLICGMGLAGWMIKNQPIEATPAEKKHNIFTLKYSTGSVHYFDLRRFGSWYLLNGLETQEWIKSHLGPDVLTEQPKQVLQHLLKFRESKSYGHLPIKVAILEQKLVAGYGNIYSCEACFTASVNPWKKFRDCSNEELSDICQGGHNVMVHALGRGGTSFRDFKNPDGVPGRAHQFLSVFRQKTCLKCDSRIQRVVLRGRGTYFCPTCQQVPEDILSKPAETYPHSALTVSYRK